MLKPMIMLGLGILLGGGIATAARAETLTVVIENIEVAEGKIMLQVMAGEAGFNGDAPAIVSLIHRSPSGDVEFTTDSLPPGEYAIRVLHDTNDNDKMDSNLVGMPTEPWGFSNNATGNFGPPGWEDVRFQLQDAVTQRIKLNQ